MSRQQDDDLRHQLDNELDSIRDLLFADDPSALIPLEAATLGEQPDTSPLAGPSRLGDSSASHPSLSSKDRVFDQYVHELAFDKRAKPKDRTKTEEELALEEKQRLEKAERRRVRRMEGLDDYDSEEEETAAKAARAQARGGDDLDDDFMGDEDTLGLGQGLMEQGAEEPRESIEGSEDEDDEDDEGSDGPAEEDSEIEGSEELSNDAASEGEDLDMEEGEHERLVSAKPRPVKRVPLDKELPYTFECPQSHEDFLEIIDGVQDSDVCVVVQRIRTLYHPSLAEDNKFKLQTLTTIIIDHILYTTTPPSPKFNVVSGLLPHLTALTRAYPTASATHFMTKLKLMEKNLKHGLSRGALDPESKTFPGLPELALLRSIGLIWSTSDMNHVVVSPTRLLMAAYLGLGRVRSLQDLASGLFVCTLWVQYEDLSTRFVPEAINFVINAILHLAPHKYEQAADVPGCFPHPDFSSELTKPLRIKSGQAPADDMSSSLDIVSILSDVRNSKAANTRLLSTSFALLGRFADKYHALDGFPELFGPILSICKGLRSKKLPSALQVCPDRSSISGA
jgi:nucleolar protein 14